MSSLQPVESFITGSEKITSIFGYWPSFHDAEVMRVQLWRGDMDPARNSYIGPEFTVELRAWELTSETNADGYLVTRHHTLVTIKFMGLEDGLELDDFNHQNAIFELQILHKTRDVGPSPYFDVNFASSFGMGACFRCSFIEIVSAEPYCAET